MLSKAHLTSHSRMSRSRWVITPSWLSGSWRSFLYSSVYSCHLFLISHFCYIHTVSVLYCAHLCMKCSLAAAAAAKSLQSCPTLCNPRDGSPPGSPIPGILQARTLEWVAISFSNERKWKAKVKSLSCVRLLATPWTAAYQAPPSMGFPGKSTGVGCHCLLQMLPWYL